MSYPRVWTVWHPASGEEGPEDGTDYVADYAELAAEKWAQDYDEDDYPLSSNEDHSEIVKVIEKGKDSAIQTFSVRASLSIDYFVNEVSNET